MGPKTPQIVALGDGGFSMERDGSLLDDYVLSVTDAARPRVCFLPPASRDGRRAGLSANKCGVAEPEQSATAARLRERREAVVREHMQSENEHDFDATIGTFSHPRYEIIPTGDVFDGEAEVRGYFAETRAAFPDQRNELIA